MGYHQYQSRDHMIWTYIALPIPRHDHDLVLFDFESKSYFENTKFLDPEIMAMAMGNERRRIEIFLSLIVQLLTGRRRL
jgi:hypothetical protein